jgi:hypothetical protein
MNSIKLGLAALTIIPSSYFLYRYKKSLIVCNHPTLEPVMMMLKLDTRVSNFCGHNYRTKNHFMIKNDDSEAIYRFVVEGMRGLCKVVVKVKKHSHDELVSHSAEQMEFSKKSKEEKAILAFNTFNYNDVIIPTTETLLKMSEFVKSQNLNFQELYEFKRENYLAGMYHSDKFDLIKLLRRPIDSSDTFYRISAITMVADDKYVFNIRPLNANYRDYDIEDTSYQYKTYSDIVKRNMNLNFEYNESLREDISAEDFKNEMVLYKQMKFQQRMSQRKYFTYGLVFFSIIAYICYNLINKHRIDVATLKALQSKIQNLSSKTPLGSTKRLICIDYYYVAGTERFRVRGLAMGEKGAKVGIDTNVNVEDTSPYESVMMYALTSNNSDNKNSEKISI